ncbi:hypothetical protein PHLGIDRAFT_26207 [Phlebiopsis gigantea 11061_1 CR5-6]|uniref:Cytochrome P450 n=1 Tax=Phlebiopsis gigantea (strain 11061_1 CR5-6) TaxID=745531 RepID=A0A0C3RSF7_PHLG1|nr:hypothetical protein PHLGIDRAFT_26207 [Phlebiopsis gigantea 11061_1 CR5-6]
MLVSAGLIAISAVFVVVVGIYLRKRRTRLPYPYPPGSKALPFIGNGPDVPQQFQWRRFCEWKYRYGVVVSITLFGQRMVILNTIQASVDLLEKKGAQYSDRPMHMMSPVNEYFRNMRKMLHRYLGARNQMDRLRPYHELIEEEIRRSLTSRDDELCCLSFKYAKAHEMPHSATSGISTRITCGHPSQEGHDHILELIERTINVHYHCATYLPGQGWKKQAVEWRALTDKMIELPYAFGKDNVVRRCHGESSIVGDYMRSDPNMPADKEYSLKKALVSMAGGTDTVCGGCSQHETDTVVGRDRLPTLSDRDRLPYLKVLYLEVLRWVPAVSISIPHLATEDNFYRGYFIPKGSSLTSGTLQIKHDMDNYKNHTEFEPEHFLGEKPELDPRDVVFGFGINLGQASLFAFCAMTLAVFDISKTVENGVEITPNVGLAEYHEAGVSHPPPFRCWIKPRSPSAEALILGDN